jgi:hypothetical protein
MSGVTGALTAGALGSGLGTLAVTGDPMKALESGALGFLTGGALGGFGGGLGSAAVEAEKAALQAAASGASSGIAGAGADALGAGTGNALSNSTQALKAAGIGGAEGALAQNAAQQAALQGVDALGGISANLPSSISNASMNSISANLPASIAGVGTTAAPALATNAGMGIGQGFKDTLGGIGGMKGLIKAGEIALPGISMSQPELAPYVAPVYTSPGLTPYQQREAGGYTPGYRPGYDPEQLYFKPAAAFADGGEVPGYADGDVVRLADGTRNMPDPSVNNLGQQPNQLGRRYDQDRAMGFTGQNEQRGFGNNMQPQNQSGMQAAKSGRSMGQGMPQPNQQMGPSAKGQGNNPMVRGMTVAGMQAMQPAMKGSGQQQKFQQMMQQAGVPQGGGSMMGGGPQYLAQAQQMYDANRNQGIMGAPGVQGLNQNSQQMNGMPQQDFAAQQNFSQLTAQNLMNQMQNGGPNTLNSSIPQQTPQSVANPYPGQTQNLGMMAGFNSQQPTQMPQQMGQSQQSMPQAGFADGGQVPASGVSARPGLRLTGVKQTGFNPAMLMAQYNGGYDRGPFASGNPFFAGRGGGMKGNGMGMPFGGSGASNRPGLKMTFADGGGIPGMSAMSMMGGMPGGDMTVPPIAGDGSSDSIPATIDGKAPALLSADEHVVPADVVAHLGNGSSSVGHKKLRNMVKKVRVKKTGKKGLPKRINPERMMPA